jgi:hypothetical protein
MSESRSALKADEELLRLYNLAFEKFRGRALWNMKCLEHPTVGEVLAITRALRVEGNLEARQLAEDIEERARANY